MIETKPGYKTTEFWLTTVAMALSTAFASGAFEIEGCPGWLRAVAGLGAALLGAFGYQVNRNAAKRGPSAQMAPDENSRMAPDESSREAGHIAVDALIALFAFGLFVALAAGGCAGARPGIVGFRSPDTGPGAADRCYVLTLDDAPVPASFACVGHDRLVETGDPPATGTLPIPVMLR